MPDHEARSCRHLRCCDGLTRPCPWRRCACDAAWCTHPDPCLALGTKAVPVGSVPAVWMAVTTERLQRLRRRQVLPCDPGDADAASIRMLRFRVLGAGWRSVTIRSEASAGPLDIHDILDGWFDREQVPPGNLVLLEAVIAILLPPVPDSGRRFDLVLAGECAGSDAIGPLPYRGIAQRQAAVWGLHG